MNEEHGPPNGGLDSLVVFLLYYQGLFCDGTRRYGVPAPFFPSKEKTIICNVYC